GENCAAVWTQLGPDRNRVLAHGARGALVSYDLAEREARVAGAAHEVRGVRRPAVLARDLRADVLEAVADHHRVTRLADGERQQTPEAQGAVGEVAHLGQLFGPLRPGLCEQVARGVELRTELERLLEA